jgi:hypothetical protein
MVLYIEITEIPAIFPPDFPVINNNLNEFRRKIREKMPEDSGNSDLSGDLKGWYKQSIENKTKISNLKSFYLLPN